MTLHEFDLYRRIQFWEVDGRKRSPQESPNLSAYKEFSNKVLGQLAILACLFSHARRAAQIRLQVLRLGPSPLIANNPISNSCMENRREAECFRVLQFRNWLVHSILSEAHPDDRVLAIQRLIDLMLIFEHHRNLQGCQEAKAALFSAAVFRLKKAFQVRKTEKCLIFA